MGGLARRAFSATGRRRVEAVRAPADAPIMQGQGQAPPGLSVHVSSHCCWTPRGEARDRADRSFGEAAARTGPVDSRITRLCWVEEGRRRLAGASLAFQALKAVHGPVRHLVEGLADGGQGRPDRRGDRRVVEADHRQVVGHLQAAALGFHAGGGGHVVIGREDGGGRIVHVQQGLGGLDQAGLEGEVAGTISRIGTRLAGARRRLR
jgi:hypothetical protein